MVLALVLVGAQLCLLPLAGIYAWSVPQRAGLRFQWVLHRALVLGSWLLPILAVGVGSIRLPADSGGTPTARSLEARAAAEPSAAAAPPMTMGAPLSEAAPRDPGRPATDWVRWGAILVSAAMTTGVTRLALRLGRHARWRREVLQGARVRRIGRLRVVSGAKVATPMSFGVLWPCIILPKEYAMSDRERAMILRHEGYHLRSVHGLWSMLETVLSAVLWFTPLPRLLALGGPRIRELLADDAVAQTHNRRAYGRLLLRAAMHAQRGVLPELAHGWMGGSAFSVRLRVLLGVDQPRTTGRTRIATGAAMVAALGLMIAGLPHLPSAAALGAREQTPDAVLDPAQSEGFPKIARLPLYQSSRATALDQTRMVQGGENNRITLDFWSPVSFDMVLAPTAAVVTGLRRDAQGLYLVTLRSANGYTIRLGNLESVTTSTGDVVNAGRMLGRAGARPTERSGSLVRYEVELGNEYLDPGSMVWLPEPGVTDQEAVFVDIDTMLIGVWPTYSDLSGAVTFSGSTYSPSSTVASGTMTILRATMAVGEFSHAGTESTSTVFTGTGYTPMGPPGLEGWDTP